MASCKKKAFLFTLGILLFATACSREIISDSIPDQKETVTDIDSNKYSVVTIGNQTWMAENLKVTRYQNGDPIIFAPDFVIWSVFREGAFCIYENDSSTILTDGLLYNWYAIMDKRCIAPAGWRVPTDEDWMELEVFLGMHSSQLEKTGWRGEEEGAALKSNKGWTEDGNGSNSSDFNALPGGFRTDYGPYNGSGVRTEFWSSSQSYTSHVWTRALIYSSSKIYRYDGSRGRGLSVRLIKDGSLDESEWFYNKNQSCPN